jgi:hypothetical protein
MILLVFLCASVPLGFNSSLRAEDRRASTVGMPARIDGLVLPGSELEVKPLTERQAPVVVRIVSVAPHGTAFRYDLEYYGLEKGTFDLRDYLRRKDRSSTADLRQPLTVKIDSVLPPGQVKPHALQPEETPRPGGYVLLLTIAGALWIIGLFVILFAGRRRAKAAQAAARPVTLADRLRPLVEGAMAGKLDAGRLADLERVLIVYWSRRLGLLDRKPADALAELRGHGEAGPLLAQLESWLHRPRPSATIDVAVLLKPYRTVPADDLEVGAHPA